MELRGFVRAAGIAAAVAGAVGAAFAAEPSFGTFTDARDGKTYKTVTIGIQAWVTVVVSGKTWMAENLKYEAPDSSWCYDNADSNCVKYGRLYTWNAAIKACPDGYHLPSRQEWYDLGKAVGGVSEPGPYDGTICWVGAGKKLKATNGWAWNDSPYIYDWQWHEGKNISGNGTDDYGFSAQPGGVLYSNDGEFHGIGYKGSWWTSTEYGSDAAYILFMLHFGDGMSEHGFYKSGGVSVRCVADAK